MFKHISFILALGLISSFGGPFGPSLSSPNPNSGHGGTSITNSDNTLFLATVKGVEGGYTYSNYNSGGLSNCYYNSRNGKLVTVVGTGDGLSVTPTVLWDNVVYPLTNAFGPIVGWGGLHFPELSYYQLDGNASLIGEHTGLFYPMVFQLRTLNDAVYFGGYVGIAANPTANQVQVFYVTEPGAGHIEIATNINGGAFTAVSGYSSIDCNAAIGIGIASWTVATPAPTAIRIKQLDSSKTNNVLCAELWDNTKTKGIIYMSVYGGASDSAANMIGTNIGLFNRVWTNVQPNLWLVEKIGVGDNGAVFDNDAIQTFTNWTCYVDQFTNLPYCDMVSAGVYPCSLDGTVVAGNNVMRTNAIRANKMYFDGHSPFIDYQNMVTRGWISDASTPHSLSGFYENYYGPLITHWLRPEQQISVTADWRDDMSILYERDEFSMNAILTTSHNVGELGWYYDGTGGGGSSISTTHTATSVDFPHVGVIEFGEAATTSGHNATLSRYYANSTDLQPIDRPDLILTNFWNRWVFKLATTNNVVYYVGLVGGSTWGSITTDPDVGAYFRWDATGETQSKWAAIIKNGATVTTNYISAPDIASYHTFKIFNDTGITNVVRFQIDGGLITSVTNKLPAKGIGPQVTMANRASAASGCKLYMDFYDLKIKGIGH